QASVAGGAGGLRIEGVDNLKAVRPVVNVPIIGIVKRDFADSPVRITALLEDIDQLAEAGADIIAFDATDRPRPVTIDVLLERVRQHGKLAMADCSNYEEGIYAHKLGIEFIGTTMSGYTSAVTPKEPDLSFVERLHAQGCRIIAEGRYNTPELAKAAIEAGAYAVTVG